MTEAEINPFEQDAPAMGVENLGRYSTGSTEDPQGDSAMQQVSWRGRRHGRIVDIDEHSAEALPAVYGNAAASAISFSDSVCPSIFANDGEHTLLRRIHTRWEFVGIHRTPIARRRRPGTLPLLRFLCRGGCRKSQRVGSALKGAA
ncbi:MAG TPA: hypothetical protein VMF67_02485 [Rhizomicrobium sp.]|nr:hypothetical protein [Rhizomicrobium sp.]